MGPDWDVDVLVDEVAKELIRRKAAIGGREVSSDAERLSCGPDTDVTAFLLFVTVMLLKIYAKRTENR